MLSVKPNAKRIQQEKEPQLFAVIGTTIKTYGNENLTLNLRKNFKFDFIVAHVNKVIPQIPNSHSPNSRLYEQISK